MKKKIISGMLSVLMLASVSVSNLAFAENSATIPAISFVDESGNAVTSAPDLGKIKIADIDGAGAKFFATYDKDGRFREMSDSDTVYVNEWAEDTYVKAFAFDSLDGIKSIAPAKKVELSTEGKELIVSYADGLPTVENNNMIFNHSLNSVNTYGNAKYSAKIGNTWERCVPLSDSSKTALKDGSHNVIKIRYYVDSLSGNKFAFILSKNTTYGYDANDKTKCEPVKYATIIPKTVGWNIATLNIAELNDYGITNQYLSLSDVTHYGIDCVTGTFFNGDKPTNPGLYIDSIWIDNEKLESDHAIDFSSDSDWNVVKVNHLTKSTEQKYGTATQSAKVTKKSDNWNYFFDLAKMGFTTDWSDYKVLKIRYYTNNVSAVPPVYLATGEGWVTSGGEIYNGSTKLKDNQGSYVLKQGTLASTKPSATGWNTVSYILPTVSDKTDFGANASTNNISMSNIPYMLIPTDGNSQWYLTKTDSNKALCDNDVTVYIDKIWLEEDLKLDDNTVIDFGNAYTWNVLGTMAQFKKDTTNVYSDTSVSKSLSANMYADTSNTTGFIDLAKVGFTTDWSEYKTINIRYYTDDATKVPPVYLTTYPHWITSGGGYGADTEATSKYTDQGSFKLKSGVYSGKKSGIKAGWNTVSYTLGDSGDFVTNQQNSAKDNMKWNAVKYLQLPTNNTQYWSGDSTVTNTTNSSGQAVYNIKDIYIDSIWLSK